MKKAKVALGCPWPGKNAISEQKRLLKKAKDQKRQELQGLRRFVDVEYPVKSVPLDDYFEKNLYLK